MAIRLAGWFGRAVADRDDGLNPTWRRRGAVGAVALLALAAVVAGIEGDWEGARLSLVVLVAFGFLFRRFAMR